MSIVFMLGNGFDLHYKLPTSYSNFLNTVMSVGKETIKPGDSVGHIFSKIHSLGIDPFISYCFVENAESFNAAVFDCSDCYKISYIQEKSKTNKWFQYLKTKLEANGNWVDFEQEVAKVVNSLQEYNINTNEQRISSTDILWAISEAFSFDGDRCGRSDTVFYKTFRKDLVIPAFPGSDRDIINIAHIIDELYESLLELNQLLRFYLECFIEKPLSMMIKSNKVTLDTIFTKADAVVTYNYTNTFEALYNHKNVCHVHGYLPDTVVLGIDSNQYDELASIDTSFIRFKKYYQRATLCTDSTYRELVWQIEQSKKNSDDSNLVELIVVGHSLDKTDKEIIQELFALADRILIYYYKKNNIENYNSNLIAMYGRQAFEALRKEKRLKYVPIDKMNEI